MNKGAILAADASRLAALLVGQMRPAFSLLAPCDPGASTAMLGTFIHERVLATELAESFRETKTDDRGRTNRAVRPRQAAADAVLRRSTRTVFGTDAGGARRSLAEPEVQGKGPTRPTQAGYQDVRQTTVEKVCGELPLVRPIRLPRNQAHESPGSRVHGGRRRGRRIRGETTAPCTMSRLTTRVTPRFRSRLPPPGLRRIRADGAAQRHHAVGHLHVNRRLFQESLFCESGFDFCGHRGVAGLVAPLPNADAVLSAALPTPLPPCPRLSARPRWFLRGTRRCVDRLVHAGLRLAGRRRFDRSMSDSPQSDCPRATP